MQLKQATEAIENGFTTASEIADYLGKDDSHTARELKKMAEGGDLAREKEGRSYRYYVPADQGDTAGLGGKVEDNSMVPMPTDYDWSEWVPTDVPEYVPTDGEYEEIEALVDNRRQFGAKVHCRLVGPTGAGKTHIARYMAQERGAPLFDISVKWATDTTSLLGRYVYVNEETRWVNGPLTKAILASKAANRDETDFDEVYLLLDEINRARPESKAALFEALDDRAQVTLDSLGGEVVEGDAQNLIVMSTMNVGEAHIVEDLDLAEQRRLGATWEIEYLGLNHPEREADLLTQRTGVHESLANTLVNIANSIRELAQDPHEAVDRGVPTGVLVQWALNAQMTAAADVADPLMRTAKSSVIREFYVDGGRPAPGRDEVTGTIEGYVDGCPPEAVMAESEFESWANADLDDVVGDSGGSGGQF
jgi:nitric oxide reductase NorQ protein